MVYNGENHKKFIYKFIYRYRYKYLTAAKVLSTKQVPLFKSTV
jgi:hypothetical protein